MENQEDSKDERYPIDTMKLNKGDNLSAEKCAEILKTVPGTSWHSLGLLALRDVIMGQSEAEHRPLSCCVKADGLHIHTDVEASEYYHNSVERHVRGVRRSHQCMVTHVDHTQLLECDQRVYERRQLAMSLQVQALNRCRRHIGKEERARLIADATPEPEPTAAPVAVAPAAKERRPKLRVPKGRL
jgi:hypothetical protein